MTLWWLSLYIVEALCAFGIVLNVVLYLMHVMSFLYAKIHMNRKPPELMKAELQGVSILKPLKGVDPNLEENLESYFELDYPEYEVIFCIQDDDDPANEVCNRVMAKHPNIPAQIARGGKKVGCNPKVNNLMQGYNKMKYNIFWICDAGIRVLPLSLRDHMHKMTDKVALVHAVPYTAHRKGFSSAVEKIYFGTQHARVYINAHIAGIICMTGMSTLIRRDVFDKCTGGLGNLSQYIAEDYFMAKCLSDNGWKCTLASYPALQNSGNYSVRGFVKRMARWTKLRIAMVPFAVLLEPVSECFLAGLFLAISLHHFLGWNMLVVFLYHVLGWFIADYMFFRSLENGHLQISKRDFLVAWFIRETLTPYVIFSALWDPTITWQNGRYRLRCGGKAEEVPSVV